MQYKLISKLVAIIKLAKLTRPQLESGDSSAVARWSRSKDCGFESHPRRKFNFCHALALRVYSAHSVNEYRLSVAEVLHIELGLKIRVYVLR